MLKTEQDISTENLEKLYRSYHAFLIRTVSNVTGRYVAIEHDDAFSIALIAFAEAVEKFDPERGAFPSFAGMVIRSRLLNWKEQEARKNQTLSLEALQEAGQEFPSQGTNDQEDLKEESISS